MNSEPLPLVINQKSILTRTKTKMALLTVVGGLTYTVVNNAVNPSYTSALGLLASTMAASNQQPKPITPASQLMAANSAAIASGVSQITAPSPTQSLVNQAVPSSTAPTRVGAGAKIYPSNPAVQMPQLLYQVSGNKQEGSNMDAVKSKIAYSPNGLETTHVIEPAEKIIPLLGPAAGRSAVVIPPFLTCTVEILEHGVLVSHQTIGCTQPGGGTRSTMLMEFGQEVPNEIPNMKYWLSVQVDGYRQGYPILRTQMEMTGLLGRSVGRRKYESVTVVEPNKKQTMIAFNIDDDDFAVTISARK